MVLDLRPPVGAFTTAFARSATVTPVGGTAIVADVIWEQEPLEPASQQVGASPSAVANHRLLAYVRRDEVSTLPPGSTIAGGPEHNQKTWRVHSIDASDPDYHIAAVT